MKFYRVYPWRSIATLSAVIVLAQTTMSLAIAQTGFSPDEVVAVIDGEEYTAKAMDQIRKSLPPTITIPGSIGSIRLILIAS